MSDIGTLLFGQDESTDMQVKEIPVAQETTKSLDKPKRVAKSVKKTKTEAGPSEPPKVFRTYEDFDYEDLLTYAGVDTLVTSSTFARMFPKAVAEPTYVVNKGGTQVKTKAKALIDVYRECTSDIFDFICDLEIHGMNYDPAENRRLNVSMLEEAKFLEDRIFSSIGKKINLDSSKDVIQLLYREKGFTPPHQTKSGEDAADGGALLTLAGLDPTNPGKFICEDPSLQYLADMAKRKNLVSVHRSFISTYMDDYLKPDGRIHAMYNQFGTSTFRLSSSEPNLQNIPRAFGVKRCFNVRPGYVFIAFDFSSAEIKLLCAISGDENMRAAQEAGLDFHSFAASEMHGIPYKDFIAAIEDKSNPLHKTYKYYRQGAKALGFGLLYGSSAAGLAHNLNISLEEAERLIELYFSKFPRLKEYIRNTHLAALWNQYVVTPFGHRRQFYGAHPLFKKTAAYNAALRGSQNFVIQSATTIIGSLAFAQVNKELKKFGGLCTATVHDSLEAEVPIEHAAKAIEVFYHYLNEWPQQTYPWLKLPIGCEGEIGFNWEDTELVHPGITQQEIEVTLAKLRA